MIINIITIKFDHNFLIFVASLGPTGDKGVLGDIGQTGDPGNFILF